MVTRKSSIPAPNAPPPPPPPPDFVAPNHDVDSTDVPPVPATKPRAEEDSPYADMGNPWIDANIPVDTGLTQHPSILRPGVGTSTTATTIPEVEDVMKPGWSGQNTPRSSIDSDRSRDFWESSEDEEEKKGKTKAKAKGKTVIETQATASESTEDLVIPSPLQIRRKPVAAVPLTESDPPLNSNTTQPGFASNNPFRKNSSAQPQPTVDSLPLWGPDIKGKGKETDPPATKQASNQVFPDYSAYHATQLQDETAQWQEQQRAEAPPAPPHAPPPIPVPQIITPFNEQPPLIPVSPRADDSANPWSSQQSFSNLQSPIPFSPSQKQYTHSSESLLERGDKGRGRISLGDELKVLPNAVQSTGSQTSLLDDDEVPPPQPPRPAPAQLEDDYAPPFGPPPSHIAARSNARLNSPPAPIKPPRPAVVVKPTSDSELAELQEQRNETYQIKHFNWFDHRSGKLRMSSMLTQNKNGPCPLLALVNALILGVRDESQAALDDALKSREQVTLGLIIETLMDELLSSGVHLDGDLPDVDELNRFLIKLRTGMNMNPRFVQPQAPPPNLMDARHSIIGVPQEQHADQPGTFESSQDIRLYGAFGITTVHGWLPDPNSEVVSAFARSAQNYEDAQVIQFGEEELEYKLSRGGLTDQEQQLWQDIIAIKTFFQQHPTQLTPHGLSCIKRSMKSGSFAILFRNDHFSTIYKHPQDGNLYTLITDAGYADRDEVIWESLVDISGQQSEFFSGDFQSVSHHVIDSSRRSSNRLSSGSVMAEPLSPQQQQEQHDADFAMALQLQEEEEQRMREQQNTRSGSNSGPTEGPNNGNTSTGGNRRGQGIPIPLRSNAPANENRPLIPPRNQRSNIPAVNRPSDELEADAPPTYEEAAKGKPYNPPLGSPLHPASSPGANPSPFGSTSNVELPGPATGLSEDSPPALRRPQRRQSAYGENSERYGYPTSPRSSSGRFEMGMSPAYNDRNARMPGAFGPGRVQGVNASSSSAGPGRLRRNEDGECTVM